MSAHTQYGFCTGCQKWVPRDEMLSINIAVYNSANEATRVRVRSCPKCHHVRFAEFKKMEWDHVLKSEHEIKSDPELAEKSELEFDDSEKAMREAGLFHKIEVDKRA